MSRSLSRSISDFAAVEARTATPAITGGRSRAPMPFGATSLARAIYPFSESLVKSEHSRCGPAQA
jgi:hypothetical protein